MEEQTTPQSTPPQSGIPPEFEQIIHDFVRDLLITFPEYQGIVNRWWPTCQKVTNEEKEKVKIQRVFDHCLRVFPACFFDILYKNEDIFLLESPHNTEFLPNIVFKNLWNCEDITDATRDVMWNYLQLILFSTMGSVTDLNPFETTESLFEAVDQDELKGKLEEVMNHLQSVFTKSEEDEGENKDKPDGDKGDKGDQQPFDAQSMNEHLASLMNGKLGRMAVELTKEMMAEMDLSEDQLKAPQDVIKAMLKNPSKVMSMMKTIGNKMNEKIQSGEIKESEIMQESMDLLKQMKDMGGMSQLFQQMGVPMPSGSGKMNTNAMHNAMAQQLKQTKQKERMKQKQQQKQQANHVNRSQFDSSSATTNHPSATTNPSATLQSYLDQSKQPVLTDDELVMLFQTNNDKHKQTNQSKNEKNKKQNKKR